MSDEALRKRIDERLKAVGLKARAASIEATGNPDAIRRLVRGHTPNAQRLQAIAAVLQTNTDYLLGRSDDGTVVHVPTTTEVVAPSPGAKPAVRDFATLPRDIPVLGTVAGGTVKFAEDTLELATIHEGDVIDYLARPPALMGRRKIYGLYHVGTSMYPRFEPGDPHWVDPDVQPRPGDDVVVQLVGPDGDGDRMIGGLVKRLVRYTGKGVVVEQFNPPLTIEIPSTRYRALHKIVSPRELH